MSGRDPSNFGGRDPSNSAQVGGAGKAKAVSGRTEAERVFRAVIKDPQAGRRVLAEECALSEWKVRQHLTNFIAWGWMAKRRRGGVIITEQGEKAHQKAVGGTLQGSPFAALPQSAVRVPDPKRLHSARLVGTLDRAVDLDSLLGFERDVLTGAHKVPTAVFRVWMDNGNGALPIPIQVFRGRDHRKPYRIVVQSLNAIHRDLFLRGMSREVKLGMLLDEVTAFLSSWLGSDAALLGPLEYRNLEACDVEEAMPVPVNPAMIGGNPQTDGIAEDGAGGSGVGSNGSPWGQEQEATLTFIDRLEANERGVVALRDEVALVLDGQKRLTAVLQDLASGLVERLDQSDAVVENLAGRVVRGGL